MMGVVGFRYGLVGFCWILIRSLAAIVGFFGICRILSRPCWVLVDSSGYPLCISRASLYLLDILGVFCRILSDFV